MRVNQRTVGASVCLVAGLGFVSAAALLVPWHPVPGGAPPAVDAASVLTADEIARAEEYAAWARVWSWTSLALRLVLLSLVGFTRIGRSLVERLPGPWWARTVVTVAAVTIGLRVVTLPFAVALQQHRLDYGLSTQQWGGWARDVLVGHGVSITMTSLAVVALVALARRWARGWPVAAALAAAALVVVGSWLYPLVVEPLFNTFEPLPQGSLRSAILETADREGVAVDEVLVADASRRTTSLNAYVSGLGGTGRVVVYDTLVETLPEDQALSVVAHELAHARHRDVLIGTCLGALAAAAAVGLLGVVLGRRRPDAVLVPLLLALLAWGSVLASPVENGISRRIETRADVDALETTGDPGAFTKMQLTLARRSLADPTPPAWSQWWWGSHPTVLERVALADE